jgi:hypothetical protein
VNRPPPRGAALSWLNIMKGPPQFELNVAMSTYEHSWVQRGGASRMPVAGATAFELAVRPRCNECSNVPST